MMRNRSLFACLSALVIAMMLPGAAMGDGCYIPQVAYPAMPTIPTQRALIVHRDGVETLIVESTFKSDSPDVGWILPLPAEPTKFEVADSGMLTSLAVCLRPEVIHDLHDYLWWPIFIGLFLVPLLLVAVLSKHGLTLIDVILWIPVFIIILAMMGGAGVSSPDVSSVQVSSTQKVGNYEVSVVRGKDAKGLAEWLQKNGFLALPPNAIAVVDDYIARGWCFAVARLHREGGGEATPHPIAVMFPAAQPIYPMRLTAAAGSPVHVELYVIADRMATADAFHLVAADRCRLVPIGSDEVWHRRNVKYDLLPLRAGEEWRTKGIWAYEASNINLCIGHEDVMALMWDGCVVARLDADLSPSQMSKDVDLVLGNLQPHCDVVFSPRGRWQAMLAVGLWGAIPVLIYCAVVCRKRRRPGPRQVRVMAILAGVVLATAVIAGLSHRTVPVGPSRSSWEPSMQADTLGKVAQAMAFRGILHSGMTVAEQEMLPRKLVELKYLRADGENNTITNALTGGPIRLERSPGNYAIRRVGDDEYFCLYDECGIERRVFILPPPGKAGKDRPKQEGSSDGAGAKP